VSDWLDVVGRGELEELRRFASESYTDEVLSRLSAEERARWEAVVLFGDTMGLDVERVERVTSEEVVLATRARLTGELLKVTLGVEPHPPHRIERLLVFFVPDEEALRVRDDHELAAELDAFVEKLAAVDRFSGALLVAREGEILLERAHGLASRAFQVPNRVDTRFNLGSMNKMFTAVAIAQLQERGELAFDDMVARHLPDYPRDVAERVTIHQLLTHTSGLGDIFNEAFEQRRRTLRSVADCLPLFADEPLQFEPGERFGYSNAGFVLLGAVVEAASGEDYFEYVRRYVYAPAGMTSTDSFELDFDHPNLAVGYTTTGPNGQPEPGPRRNNLWLHVLKGGPAGGGFSTVEDLHRFGRALTAGRLLSTETTELVLEPKVEVAPGMHYAYGFQVQNGPPRIVGHGGGFPGINAAFDLDLDGGYVVAVLANVDPPAAGRVAMRAQQLLAARR
jgi:CubicO group peptidase (beta-lactamase class C family)